MSNLFTQFYRGGGSLSASLAIIMVGLFFQISFAQHIPPNHNSHHTNTGSTECHGYATGRAFGKTLWTGGSCPLWDLNFTAIPEEYFDTLPYLHDFLESGDIVSWGGTHSTYLVSASGNYNCDNVNGPGQTPLSRTLASLISEWGQPESIKRRKKDLWEVRAQNDFGVGKIGYQGIEYNSPFTKYNIDWTGGITITAVENGRDFNNIRKIFQRWEDDQGTLVSTNPTAFLRVGENHQVLKTYTAVFLNEYDVPLVNQFVGLPNSGTIKVNGVTKTLPDSFPVLQGNSINVEALNQIINGINYRFDKYNDGTTSYYKTIYPEDERTWIAEFEGIPLMVTGAYNTAPAGSNVHLVWDIHPNPNIRYHIFRKVKGVSGTYQIANLPRTTTSFTDYDYVVTNGYSDKLISYDVRAYYTTESTYADYNWWSLFGSIAPKLAAGSDSLNIIPFTFGIRNFPNPFNPSTTIEYVIPEPGDVQVRIVDISGRIVKTLVKRNQSSGKYFTMWDGTNEYSEKVVSGFYFLQLVGNGQTAIRKILLIK